MEKPILTEQYSDNGEFSHWHLIENRTGKVLWSSFPEETIAQGQRIDPNPTILEDHPQYKHF
jgi:hypothetical protein